MEHLYFFDMDSLSAVIIADTHVFHYLCCELFLPVHTGVVALAIFGCSIEVGV